MRQVEELVHLSNMLEFDHKVKVSLNLQTETGLLFATDTNQAQAMRLLSSPNFLLLEDLDIETV